MLIDTTLRRKNRSSRKCSGGDRLLEVAVGGGDDAHVDAHVAWPPNRENSPSCRTCSSLAWSDGSISPISSRKIVPWLANSNLPGLRLQRAGERAALEAEQLRFQELGRQRRAIDLHERLVAPRRRRAQRARDELLAGSALATNQHGGVRVGDQRDQLAHLAPSARLSPRRSIAGSALLRVALLRVQRSSHPFPSLAPRRVLVTWHRAIT